MTGFGFLILLTFAAPAGHVEFKRVECANLKCVEMFQESARASIMLTRFQVFKRGEDGIVAASGKPMFRPVIDWSPL